MPYPSTALVQVFDGPGQSLRLEEHPLPADPAPPFPLADLEEALQVARNRSYFRVSVRPKPA